jgi:hypothetical protein
MSFLSAIKDYLKTNPNIASQTPIWVDFMGEKASEITIIQLPGNKVLESYINGDSRRVFPFAIQSMESTADELQRIQNSGFYEDLSDWLESQDELKVYPVLDAGKTAERIETMGWGYLVQQGNSQTGIYQISCRLIYYQEA